MVTNGITYGASQLTSDGVSYQKKDGELTTVKKALDELITKSSKVDELEEHAKLYKYAYLYDAVKVGDYVAYDAGTWNNSKDIPATHGEFGGYTQNKNRGESVICDNNSTELKGWRVLKKESGKVYLVHAGQPECYYHINNTTESISKLNARADEYKNEYAESARSIVQADIENLDADNNLRKIGTYYWLANVYADTELYYIHSDGKLNHYFSAVTGFRPVVELKSNILTTGQGPDKVGNPNAWTLVLPN